MPVNKHLRKNNRSNCVTRIPSLAIAAQTTFETYNEITNRQPELKLVFVRIQHTQN